MELLIDPAGYADWRGRRVRCALGRAGVTAAKREGDGATPAGRLPLRRVLYRRDRIARPRTVLPCAALSRRHGWCDDAADARYNREVRLPYPARCETLWRDDGVYDLVVVLGHNDAPVEPGRGSAIFLHVARPDYAATEGCIALAKDDLLEVLASCGRRDAVRVPIR